MTNSLLRTGYHRKYAIAVLNHPPAERPLPIHHPPGQRYDTEVQAALMRLWEAAGGICSKRLVWSLPGSIALAALATAARNQEVDRWFRTGQIEFKLAA